MSAYSQRLPAWLKHGDDLSISGFQEQSQCNWPSSQAGELLSICLDRPACEHNSWNAYGGTRVGPKTVLCKADLDCPAGLAVNKALLRAQHRFGVENLKLCLTSDRQNAHQRVYQTRDDGERTLDSLYMEDDSVSGLISIAHFLIRMILIR